MNKIIPIITFSLFLLSACGGSSDSEDQITLEDSDNDTIVNTQDNCPSVPNTDQIDSDGNGIGDVCETIHLKEQALEKISQYAKSEGATLAPSIQDYIDAGVVGVTSDKLIEVNQTIASLNAEDVDTQAEIQKILDDLNIVIPDFDGDGINNDMDNCPAISNTDQEDSDGVLDNDAVVIDSDGDGVPDSEDAFPWNPKEYADEDGDGLGDNIDTDGDGYTNAEEFKAGTDPLDSTDMPQKASSDESGGSFPVGLLMLGLLALMRRSKAIEYNQSTPLILHILDMYELRFSNKNN